MKTKVSRYDSADYLKTPEDIALYFEAVMEEGGDDASYVAHALGVIVSSKRTSPETFFRRCAMSAASFSARKSSMGA